MDKLNIIDQYSPHLRGGHQEGALLDEAGAQERARKKLTRNN